MVLCAESPLMSASARRVFWPCFWRLLISVASAVASPAASACAYTARSSHTECVAAIIPVLRAVPSERVPRTKSTHIVSSPRNAIAPSKRRYVACCSISKRNRAGCDAFSGNSTLSRSRFIARSTQSDASDICCLSSMLLIPAAFGVHRASSEVRIDASARWWTGAAGAVADDALTAGAGAVTAAAIGATTTVDPPEIGAGGASG